LTRKLATVNRSISTPQLPDVSARTRLRSSRSCWDTLSTHGSSNCLHS